VGDENGTHRPIILSTQAEKGRPYAGQRTFRLKKRNRGRKKGLKNRGKIEGRKQKRRPLEGSFLYSEKTISE